MKAYMFRHPQGQYRQKATGGDYTEEVNVNCLFVSRRSLRASLYGIITPSIKKACSYPADELKKTNNKFYWDAARDAYKHQRKLSDDVFFQLLELDGYTVIEIDINIPGEQK